MKVVKILAGATGLVVVLAIAAVLIVPALIDPNDYRARIEALAKEHTGRELKIAGDVKLSLFPWLGVTVNQVTLGNAPGFDEPYFAQVGSMRVQVKLLPLLSRELEMDTVEVEGLKVSLARNSSGVSNWDDLARAGSAADTNGDTAGGLPDNGAPIAVLALGGINVKNAGATWHDAAAGKVIKLQNLQATSGPIRPGSAVALSLSFDVDGMMDGLSGHVDTSAKVAVSADGSVVSATEVELVANLKGPALPDGQAKVTGKASEAVLDARRQTGKVSGLVVSTNGLSLAGISTDIELAGAGTMDLAAQIVDLADVKASGTMRGTNLPGGEIPFEVSTLGKLDLPARQLGLGRLQVKLPSVRVDEIQGQLVIESTLEAKLDARQFALVVQSLNGSFTGDALPDGKLEVDASSEVALDLERQTLSIKRLDLSAADLRGSLTAQVTQLLGNPAATGTLDLAQFSPRALLALAGQAPLDTADGEALGRASVSSNYTASAKNLILDGLKLRLDDTSIQGKVSVPDLGKQALSFDLAIDTLDVDRYLPATPRGDGRAQTSPATASPGGAAVAATGLPLEAVRALDLNGRLRVEKLKAMQLELTGVEFGVLAKDGLIEVAPLKAGLYGGTYQGAVKLDATGDNVTLSVDETLSKVQADRLLAALKVNAGVNLGGGRSTLSVKAKATGDPAKQAFKFDKLGVKADLAGKDFPKGRLQFTLDADVDLDLQAQQLTANALQIDLGGIRAAGDVAVSKLLSEPNYTATLKLPKFNPRSIAAALGQSVPPTADPRALASAELSVQASGTPNSVDLTAIDLALDQSRMTGDLRIVNFASPSIQFALAVDAINADWYLPPAGRDGAQGRSVQPGKDRSASGQSSPTPAGTPAGAATLLPAELIRALDLNGELTVGSLTLNNLRLSNVVFKAKAEDGQLILNPLKAELYQGRYTGNVRVDARGKQPTVKFDEKLENVQAGPLLRDLQGKEPLTGMANAAMRGTATGEDELSLRKTLSGDLQFDFRDGKITGVDLLGLICSGLSGLGSVGEGKLDAKALLGGLVQGLGRQAVRESTGAGRETDGGTRFAELSGTVQIDGGLASNRDLQLRSPLLRVGGDGQADLVTERVDYTANARLVKSCSGQGARDDNLSGIDIPVRITGSFSAPRYEPQLAGVLDALARTRRNQQTSEAPSRQTSEAPSTTEQTQPAVQQSPKDALKSILKGGLRGLLGN